MLIGLVIFLFKRIEHIDNDLEVEFPDTLLNSAKGAILIFVNFDSLGGLLTGFDRFSLVQEPLG